MDIFWSLVGFMIALCVAYPSMELGFWLARVF